MEFLIIMNRTGQQQLYLFLGRQGGCWSPLIWGIIGTLVKGTLVVLWRCPVASPCYQDVVQILSAPGLEQRTLRFSAPDWSRTFALILVPRRNISQVWPFSRFEVRASGILSEIAEEHRERCDVSTRPCCLGAYQSTNQSISLYLYSVLQSRVSLGSLQNLRVF